MDTLSASFFSLLLMVLIARAAVGAAKRRDAGSLSFWWVPVARSFAAAGVFLILGLVYFVLAHRCALWRWAPSLPIDEPGSNYQGTALIGLVLADIAVLYFVCKPLRRDWRPPAETELDRRPVGLLLLVGLAVSLWIPWLALFDLAPHILDLAGTPLRYVLPARIVADLGLGGWIGYAGVTCLGMHPSDVVTDGLSLLSVTILLLWLFHFLWDRAMEHGPGPRSRRPNPTDVTFR